MKGKKLGAQRLVATVHPARYGKSQSKVNVGISRPQFCAYNIGRRVLNRQLPDIVVRSNATPSVGKQRFCERFLLNLADSQLHAHRQERGILD